jgi:hypothetical protein
MYSRKYPAHTTFYSLGSGGSPGEEMLRCKDAHSLQTTGRRGLIVISVSFLKN